MTVKTTATKAHRTKHLANAKAARDAKKLQADREAFFATDEGKAILARMKQDHLDGEARKVAEKVLAHVHRRAQERGLFAEIARFAAMPLFDLLDQAGKHRGLALEVALGNNSEDMYRHALEIEEAVNLIREELRTPLDDADSRGVRERGFVLTLANLYARVQVTGQAVADWTDPGPLPMREPAETVMVHEGSESVQ